MITPTPTNTLLFKQVFPDLATFKEVLTSNDMQTHTIVYEYGSSETTAVEFDKWTSEVWRLLFRRYKHWQIAYMVESDFIDNFMETIEVQVPNYFARNSRYNALLKMSEKELLKTGYSVDNFIEHTDEEVTDPLNTELSQITNQSQSVTHGDKVSRLRTAISAAQYSLKTDFLNKFKWLFIKFNAATTYLG